MANPIPRLNEPVLLADGRINPVWYRFFSKFQRDFEASGPVAGDGIGVSDDTVSITTGGVTSAMLRDSLALSVIGRATATDGVPGDIVATANDRVLMRSGDVVGFFPLTTSASLSDGDYGDIVISGGGTVLTVDTDAVGNTKLANMVQATIKGRAAGAGTGDPADLTATQAWGVLATATQAITTSGLTIATARLAGRTTAATGAIEEISVSSPLSFAAGALGITGAALTRTNDTNVTLTLGGSPSTALLAATSITVGWTGTLSAARGGTGVGALGDITKVDDTNVTLTLGGTPTGAVITSTSFTLGWTGILASSRGGTGNGFTKFSGPATTEKTFTLPNASDTIVCYGTAGSFTAAQTFLNSSGIKILDTDASHTLGLIGGSNLTANRTLTITTGDASRTLTFTADASIGGTNTGDQTITLTGEVTGSGTGSFATTITADAVTDTKLRNSAALSVIGRSANSIGDPADIAAGTDNQVLRRSGATLGFGAVNLASTDAVTGTLPVGNGGIGVATITGLMQGNGTSAVTAVANSSTVGQVLRVTGASTYGWGAVDLADTDAITGDLPFANLTQGSALSVLGVTGNAIADHASIAAANDGEVLRRSGTSVGFGTIATAGVANDAITYAKIQNVSASPRVLGRTTAGAGDIEEISTTGTVNVVFSASPTLTGTLSAAAANFTGTVTISAGNRLGVLQTSPGCPVHVGAGSISASYKDGIGGSFTPDIQVIPTSAIAGLGLYVNDGVSNRRAAMFLDHTNGIWGLSHTFSSGSNLPFNIRGSASDWFTVTDAKGFGYPTGQGGTVTQATSKATGVTLNKPSGEITMNGAALAAATIVSFVLTNSAISATDNLILNHVSVGTFGAYLLNARCAAGSATIDVRNTTAGSLSEAIVLRFTLIKGATS